MFYIKFNIFIKNKFFLTTYYSILGLILYYCLYFCDELTLYYKCN